MISSLRRARQNAADPRPNACPVGTPGLPGIAIVGVIDSRDVPDSDDRSAALVLAKDNLRHLRGVLFGRTLTRPTIHPAIARMVRVKQQPWPPTPRVFAVATYNFDDLVEQVLREAGLGFTVYCSPHGEMVSNRGETRRLPSALDIYHLHGIAPGGWIVDLNGIDLVFTAEQYTVQ